MKFQLITDNREEVIVYARKKTELISKIEELCLNDEQIIDAFNCFGYLENDIVPLKLTDIVRFFVHDNKTYAVCEKKYYQIKMRLYQVEERLGNDFIRINKSCIINIDKIKKFDSSWNGTLLVEMKNGDTDYVSRRLIKQIKERIGVK